MFSRYSLVVLTFALTGCGQVGEVSGTVTIDGKPLDNVVVGWWHEERDHDRMARTTTDAQGQFCIALDDAGRSSAWPTGPHVVTVIDPVSAMARFASKGKVTIPSRVPARYENIASPVRVTLSAGDSHGLLFELSN